jgi:hypothetical protein
MSVSGIGTATQKVEARRIGLCQSLARNSKK